jgi:hypothetical protein
MRALGLTGLRVPIGGAALIALAFGEVGVTILSLAAL